MSQPDEYEIMGIDITDEFREFSLDNSKWNMGTLPDKKLAKNNFYFWMDDKDNWNISEDMIEGSVCVKWKTIDLSNLLKEDPSE